MALFIIIFKYDYEPHRSVHRSLPAISAVATLWESLGLLQLRESQSVDLNGM